MTSRQAESRLNLSGFEALVAQSLQFWKAFICSAAVIYHRVCTTGTHGKMLLNCSRLEHSHLSPIWCSFTVFPMLIMAVAAGPVRLAVWCIKVCAWLWCEKSNAMSRTLQRAMITVYMQKCALQTLRPSYQLGRTCELMGSKSSWCNTNNWQHSAQLSEQSILSRFKFYHDYVFIHTAYTSIAPPFQTPKVYKTGKLKEVKLL